MSRVAFCQENREAKFEATHKLCSLEKLRLPEGTLDILGNPKMSSGIPTPVGIEMNFSKEFSCTKVNPFDYAQD